MSTFRAVDDAALNELINSARKRIVFIAPGLHESVATALGRRFSEIEDLHITVVIDPDEDVCRIGYGDASGLKIIQKYAEKEGFWLKAQPGLRIGVLLADEQTLIWSPTPRSVEMPPSAEQTGDDLFSNQIALAPNGLWLGGNPGEQLAKAVSAEGTDTTPTSAEIGRSAVTPQQVSECLASLENNPPIPVDLQRITRVFSTMLQFVELKVTRAKLSRTQLTIPNQQLNADIKGELQGLIDSKLRAFGDLRTEEILVPAYSDGVAVRDDEGNQRQTRVSEASLERLRNDLERRYIYNIPGFGRLIAKDDKGEFEKLISAYKEQLKAHSKAIRVHLSEQSQKIIGEAVDLIIERAARSSSGIKIDRVDLKKQLASGLERAREEVPEVTLNFKDVTYEQTKSADFRKKVDQAVPKSKRGQLGQWHEHFDAAKAAV
jgi:hypothetical protein